MARSATWGCAGRPRPGLSRDWGTTMKKPHYTDVGKSPSKDRKEAATALSVAALGFLAAEPERLERFLALTGLGPQSLRAAAREPSFLIGVLEHVAGDETLLLAFADEGEIDPQDVGRALEALADRPGHTGAA
jgi:hypothetical protein